MKRKDYYLNVVKLVAKNPNLYKKVPKFGNANAVLEAAKEDINVLRFIDKSLKKTNPEIGFIYDNAGEFFDIYKNPGKFLSLQTEYFRHKDFIDVAMGVVKNSLKRSVAKVKNVSDDYVESVKRLLNSIENKANKEFKQIEEEKIEREKQIQLEKEQEEVRRKEEDEKSLRMKENKEKTIELIEGFDLKTKTADDGRSI